MKVKLNEIFIFEAKDLLYEKKSLLALDIKREFIERLAKHLDLTYKTGIEVTENPS